MHISVGKLIEELELLCDLCSNKRTRQTIPKGNGSGKAYFKASMYDRYLSYCQSYDSRRQCMTNILAIVNHMIQGVNV